MGPDRRDGDQERPWPSGTLGHSSGTPRTHTSVARPADGTREGDTRIDVQSTGRPTTPDPPRFHIADTVGSLYGRTVTVGRADVFGTPQNPPVTPGVAAWSHSDRRPSAENRVSGVTNPIKHRETDLKSLTVDEKYDQGGGRKLNGTQGNVLLYDLLPVLIRQYDMWTSSTRAR